MQRYRDFFTLTHLATHADDHNRDLTSPLPCSDSIHHDYSVGDKRHAALGCLTHGNFRPTRLPLVPIFDSCDEMYDSRCVFGTSSQR